MASPHRLDRRTPRFALGALAATLAAAAGAQTDGTQLAPVQVTGRATPPATIGGWGDQPLAKTPLQASVFGSETLKDAGAQRLSDLVVFDPGVGDAYNSEGYWDFLQIRGFTLDNRFNYRRDGLPINAETSVPLDNKARIEILKGLSGLQAGTSAPGGLVNYVVKRPGDTAIRSAMVEWRERGSVTAAVDIGQRFGADQAGGLRLNAAAAHLDPNLRNARGNRSLLAIAGDWRLDADTLVEAEFETSHRRQPSQPGFSLRGDTVPQPVDPRINLNNQPWSLPVVLDGDTASLRVTRRLGADWRAVLHAATQRLKSDDRVAFPFGVFDPITYLCTLYCDRFAPDGTYTMWEFRSDGERRRTDAVDLSLQGRAAYGSVTHEFSAGVLWSRVRNRFGTQVFDIAGTGNDSGTLATPPSPGGIDQNTDRDERSAEFYLRDRVTLASGTGVWYGARHTRLNRDSVRTDGSGATSYGQSFTTPFLAVSRQMSPEQMVYASWGRGVESEVAPGRSRYTNAGQALPALKSRQWEFGWKGSRDGLEWNLAAFDIVKPLFADVGNCDVDASCTRVIDGRQHHRGVEASVAWRSGPLQLRGAAQQLRARVEGRAVPASNGLRPTNVPETTVRLGAAYSPPDLPGASVEGMLVHEGSRMVTPDNAASIPGYERVDLSARLETRLQGVQLIWRAGIDNLFDRRAWKESPYQFSHAYLFPLAGRTFRLSVQADL